jgi:polyvinyl alcohol dehydrogenase (cytochrome)
LKSPLICHICSLLILSMPAARAQDPGWPFAGKDLSNTRFASAETLIGAANASQLQLKWVFTTADDVSATPSVDAINNVVYIPDWAGHLYKINADTGQAIWTRSMTDYGLPSGAITRTTPTLAGNVLVIGASSPLADSQKTAAFLIALDTANGGLLWKQQTDPSTYGVMTTSPVIYQGVVYTGISSAEEKRPQPVFRGSAAAYDLGTGRLIWRTYMTPPGYTGAPIWSSTPVVDLKRGSLYVTTGNNYTVPATVETCEKNNRGNPDAILACQDPSNLFNSVVSLDLATGAVKWAMRGSSADAWKVACNYSGPTCPDPEGPDFDFGAGANLFTATIQGALTDVVGAGQKSGNYWALNPDTGAVLWVKAVGPGGKLGGIQWGAAMDGQRIYAAISNSTQTRYRLQPSGVSWNGASWAAINPGTGDLIWQVPDPGSDPVHKRQPAMAMAPVTVANGVVYAASMSGTVYALSAATGATLWSYDTGGSVNAGAAVVNGTVYWGSGYGHFGGIFPVGTHNNKFFAFSLPN